MRKAILVFTASILLLICGIVSADEIGVKTEFSSDANGNILIRSITPGQPEQRESEFVSNQTDQEVLWYSEDPAAIAHDVEVDGGGQYSYIGWYLNNERLDKHLTQGAGTPLWSYPIVPTFYMPVAASDDGNVVTSTGATIPLSVWLNCAGPTPSWQYTYTGGFNGKFCDVSDDGQYVVTVSEETGGSTNARLLVFDSASANPLWTAEFDRNTQLLGVDISEDNQWILIGTYNTHYVYQVSTMSLLTTIGNYGQTMPAYSGNGEYLATGDFNGQLKLFQRQGSSYVLQWSNPMGGWVTAVAVSSDGSTVMGGNFLYSPAYAGKARGFDIIGNQLWNYEQYGDYVDNVRLCDDGSIGIATSWGSLNTTFGDVFTAFNMASGDVIFRLLDDIDEPGSLFGCSISDDGLYAIAGGKSVHARTFGNGGQVYCIMLGSPGPFNVDITLTPVSSPIVIPAIGGSFDYTVNILNNEANPVSFNAWIMAQLPSGGYYGPIINRNLNMSAGYSLTRQMTQTVPASAPAGTYSYIGRVGSYPNNIWDESSFTFEKTAVDFSAGGGWNISGWDNEETSSAVEKFTVMSNYPNPFNPATVISFELKEAGEVSLIVYDVQGREVQSLVTGHLSLGYHEAVFDGSDLSSGIYIAKLETDGFSGVSKMLLLK
ncbi:T9SS type A sorting domain-containing protein [bacterium]|nr:T9SS type A sorting domain-containing protein [FCB group bacterium]MBL7191695.1 T9SS type A sorting domain-containing protein [bacterium]